MNDIHFPFAAQVTVEKQPQNFQSYILHASNGAVYRDVFAFQCSFHTEPFTLTPVITWEQCNPDNTFSPVVEATQTVPAPGLTATNIVTPTHIFFQTNATGYLQIHDTNNSAHQGTRYRCKASSSIALDTQAPVYSGCAQIIYQANTVREFTCILNACILSFFSVNTFYTIQWCHVHIQFVLIISETTGTLD